MLEAAKRRVIRHRHGPSGGGAIRRYSGARVFSVPDSRPGLGESGLTPIGDIIPDPLPVADIAPRRETPEVHRTFVQTTFRNAVVPICGRRPVDSAAEAGVRGRALAAAGRQQRHGRIV